MALWAITTPTQLISYHEVKFLEAEALCRLGRKNEAEAALKEAVIAGFANTENMLIDATENWVGGEVNLGADVAEDYFEKSVKPLFAVNPERNNYSEIPVILRSVRRVYRSILRLPPYERRR